MRGTKLFRMQIIALVCIGLMLPHTVIGAAPTPQVKMIDVALGNGGTLVGQVVDQQGLGIADAQVVILQQGRKPVQTVADKNGKFQAAGLNGGTAQVVTAGGQGVYRLWAANTAPPAASRSALLLSNGTVLRGQDYCGPMGGWLLPALAAGGIIAGVAVATSNTSSTPASP